MPVVATHTTYPADNVEIPCFFCTPDGDGPFPPVMVIHGSDGFKENHADIALRLTRNGFAAIGPTWVDGDKYRPEAHADSWAKSIAFLKKQLGG